MEVGIVTVGDELLSGDTVNANATWLCKQLHERGVGVRRVVVVPDEIEEIAAVIARERSQSGAIIVTGGVGPTHDDVTLDAIAQAVERPLVEHQEAKRWLTEEGGYSAASLVEGTVDLPAGATAIHNEVGVAPGAIVDGIYVFPGVPAEMQTMFESVADDFAGTPRIRRTVTIDEPESHLIDRFATMQEAFNVAIGSYPGEQVSVRISGTEREEVDAAAQWLSDRAETVSTEEGAKPHGRDEDTQN